MRVNGPARLAALSLVAASTLAAFASPAGAAAKAPVTPTVAGNDGVKSFSVTADAGGFKAAGQESVVLHADPTNAAQPDITATNIAVAGCSGVPGMQTCTGPLTFDADLTNVAVTAYDVVETETDTLPAPFGAAPIVTTLTKAITVFAQPKFAATAPIAPAAVGQNNGLTVVTLKGTGFATGMTADFGNGVTVTGPLVVSADHTTATANVMVAPDAVVGTRDVTIADHVDGSPAVPVTKTAGFTVDAAPTVTDVTPASGVVTVKQSITITGTGFVAGPDFKVNMADPSIVIDNIKVVSATQVTADVTPGKAARKGTRALNVVNPDGGSASKADAYTIVAAPGSPTGLVAQAGDTVVLLTWKAPADPGTSPVTGYRVTFTGGGTTSSTTPNGTAAYVPGLVNGTTYTFTVAAKNASAVMTDGTPVYGAESAPITATPKFATGLTAAVSANGQRAGTKLKTSGSLNRYPGGSKGAPIAGASIVVRYAPAIGKAFSRTVTTGADGTWTDSIAPVYNTTVTATYAGTSSVAGATSKALPIQVSALVTVSTPAATSTSSSAKPLAIRGGISPNKAGRTIGLYRGSAIVARATVAANGTYAFSVRLAKGTYALHVNIGPTPGNVTGNSPVLTVKRT